MEFPLRQLAVAGIPCAAAFAPQFCVARASLNHTHCQSLARLPACAAFGFTDAADAATVVFNLDRTSGTMTGKCGALKFIFNPHSFSMEPYVRLKLC